ncbi:MAG: methylated-DNA--[protein]-cysteine S-methyltransferase [Pseudomonadota bacterium]
MQTYVSSISTEIGTVVVTASQDAILSVAFIDNDKDSTDEIKNNRDSFDSDVANENAISQQGAQQLKEYFAGERRAFSLPLSPQGTTFQNKVWEQLCEVDYGKTASYLDIAKALGKPTASRAVGTANGKNPIAIIIPCHRIIGANGSLTGYAGGLDRKSFLLNLESH